MKRYLTGAAGLFLVALFCSLSACGVTEGENKGKLPDASEFPGLTAQGKTKIYFMAKDREKYLGPRAPLFDQYGLRCLYVGDYTLGGAENFLTAESFEVDGELGAAGIYYYYFGKVLFNQGKEADVGTQGVLDSAHENRNLYFYKGQYFVAIVYTGKAPVPDLVPLGRWVAEHIPGKGWKPLGFRYLDVEGVSKKFTRVTYGNALNMDFLPPSVWTLSMCAGMKSKVFASTFIDKKNADQTEAAFLRYLRLDAQDYKKSTLQVGGNKYEVHQALDKDEGLILYVRWQDVIFIITHPDSAEKAKELFTRLIEQAKTVPVR